LHLHFLVFLVGYVCFWVKLFEASVRQAQVKLHLCAELAGNVTFVLRLSRNSICVETRIVVPTLWVIIPAFSDFHFIRRAQYRYHYYYRDYPKNEYWDKGGNGYRCQGLSLLLLARGRGSLLLSSLYRHHISAF
jgi:hypothetical protein